MPLFEQDISYAVYCTTRCPHTVKLFKFNARHTQYPTILSNCSTVTYSLYMELQEVGVQQVYMGNLHVLKIQYFEDDFIGGQHYKLVNYKQLLLLTQASNHKPLEEESVFDTKYPQIPPSFVSFTLY